MSDYNDWVDEELAGMDSPTDFDEYEMNPDDCGPDEQQEWHDFDPDC